MNWNWARGRICFASWVLAGLAALGCAESQGPGGGGSGGEDAAGGQSGNGGQGGTAESGGSDGAGGSGGGFGTTGYDCTPPSGDLPPLQATPIVTTLSEPMLVTHEPDGEPGRLFVLEREGRIHVIEDGSLVPEPFLDFSTKVEAGEGELGALGFAFHPNYAENGLFYVHYNDVDAPNHDSLIEEYQVDAIDPNVVDIDTGRLVLRVPQRSSNNHKGGSIAFGADGFLYFGLGDGGSRADPDENGQNLRTLLGKILRIDPLPSGDEDYGVPADNPWVDAADAAPEIWAYGLRNPFRFSFDGCTGDLYIGDVGQNHWEEIDIEKAGEGGKNYGWNTMEGTHCFDPSSDCDPTGLTLPALDYGRSDGKSVTGGAVYRGASIPSLRGRYFYADWVSGAIWSIAYDRDSETASAPFSHTSDLNNVTQVVSIANGADGELYLVSLGGGLYKLEAAE